MNRPDQHLTPPASTGGFFAFHGPWAPGVRLFRRISFAAKAVLISLAFMGPMGGLLVWQLSLHASREIWALSLAVFSGAVMLAGYLFVCFYRVMDGGLKETSRHLRAMTAGDLTTTPRPWGRDEAAVLMLDLRAMQDSLRGMVNSVRKASDSIQSYSGEIAASAQEMAMCTEEAALSPRRGALPRSPAPSTASPSRPTCWR